MKKVVIVIIACLLLVGWEISGYCQNEDGSDSEAESETEQPESELDQNLESEISDEQDQSEQEIGQMEETMDTGTVTN
ncbi:MAG: hypothetical protein KKH77_03705 [Candidatus Omnitrophica bacterium]|nr:hypothetical protein [Candidatus Omnitrophota bacterium]MBU0895846.1 hypothetical protein [Candidatus Omnitrophota bacterium]MBU1809402.1 hypothetical protein [Candidatus Omnitrophota bacterium]